MKEFLTPIWAFKSNLLATINSSLTLARLKLLPIEAVLASHQQESGQLQARELFPGMADQVWPGGPWPWN